jgi:hypothetical protein
LTLTGSAVPAATREAPRYLYYLHGMIIEEQGPEGVSPRFGRYDYRGIFRAFERAGLEVVSEVRPKGTDPSKYADKVVADVRRKLASGVPASHITIVGASRGALIAMFVSTRLRNDGVRYVLLANCNASIERNYHPRLTGQVLSIYEASDQFGHSCRPIARRSPALKRFAEVRLQTGLGHAMVYRPLGAWVDPAARWAKLPDGQ